MRAVTLALCLTATATFAEWRFEVMTDEGVPLAASVQLFKPQAPVGSATPCRLPTGSLVSGAPVTSERCEDLESAAELIRLARAFKPPRPFATAQADHDGLGAVDVNEREFDVAVSRYDATWRFRVRPVPGVTTRLIVKPLTDEQLRDWDYIVGQFEKERLWLVAVNWPDVVPPGSPRWTSERLAPGAWVLLSESGSVRTRFELGGTGGRARRSPEAVSVTRRGKPVKGARVVAAGIDSRARGRTDAKGVVKLPISILDTVVAVDGRDCAWRGRSGKLELAPCTLVAVQVVDAAGAPVRDAMLRLDDEDRSVVSPLQDGRLLVPADAAKASVDAPGFASVSVDLRASKKVVLTERLHRHALTLWSADGVRCEKPELRAPRSVWFHRAGSLYETSSVAARVGVSCGEGPRRDVTIDQPTLDVTLPREVRWRLPEDESLVAPSLSMTSTREYVMKRNDVRFFEPDAWPTAWLRRCPYRGRCSIDRVEADGGVSVTQTPPVRWAVTVERPDGGVQRGGSVSVRGGAAGETHVATVDQVGRAELESSPGWFFVSLGDEVGQWCLAGRSCVLREAPEAARGVVRLRAPGANELLVSGPGVTGELIDGVATLEVAAGAYTVVVAGTRRVSFTVKAGQELEVPVRLSAPRPLDFVVRGPSGPIAGAVVQVGVRYSLGWEPAQWFESDSEGRVHVEAWRPGDVPFVVSASGHESLAVDGSTLDGGVLLSPARTVRLTADDTLWFELPPPAGFPSELWSRQSMVELTGPDAGVDLGLSSQTVAFGSGEWRSGRVVVPAGVTTLDVRRPAGKATAACAVFGSASQLELVPGAPLSDDELRSGTRRAHDRFSCFAQFGDAACVVGPLPPGPATVVLSPPESSRGPSLVWSVNVPDAGALLLSPPPTARVVQ